MEATKTSAAAIRLKLLVDASGKRVVFAEAGKEFVDFILRSLMLPVVAIENDAAFGSAANLHRSFQNLDDSYIVPTTTKAAVLKSRAVDFSSAGEPFGRKKLYTCSSFHPYYSDSLDAVCPACGRKTLKIMTFVGREGGGEGGDGVVKDLITYMVTDDLTVMPLSTMSTITVLRKLNLGGVTDLEEKVVNLPMAEGLQFLKSCLHSKNVLTDYFLNKKRKGGAIKREGDDTTPGATA